MKITINFILYEILFFAAWNLFFDWW